MVADISNVCTEEGFFACYLANQQMQGAFKTLTFKDASTIYHTRLAG
jgi:hypothetical protein